MNVVEKKYFTRLTVCDVNLSSKEAGRVIRELKQNYDEGSTPTGNGRAYLVEDGMIEHSMGPQPELTIKSPMRVGAERIAEKFNLPL